MQKVNRYMGLILTFLFMLFICGDLSVQAGTKDLEAGKREKFKDDNVESMRDVFERKESEEKEYKEKILSNSDKTVQLLKEIKDLLIQLNHNSKDKNK